MKKKWCDCRDADLLLVANKGGFAFAVDPDTGERVWATAVGVYPKHVCHCLNSDKQCMITCGVASFCAVAVHCISKPRSRYNLYNHIYSVNLIPSDHRMNRQGHLDWKQCLCM